MTAATPFSRRQRPARATSNACPEGKPFGSGEASTLPPGVRAALVRDYVAKVSARRTAARAAVPTASDYTDDAPDMMKCARCGLVQPERERCDDCGEPR